MRKIKWCEHHNHLNFCVWGLQLHWQWHPPAELKAMDMKRKTTCMSVSLYLTTSFPNVSYVNSSKRLRKAGCSNEGKKKQARRQEEKKAATRDGEDGGRERITNGRERKRDSMWISGLKWLRGKHNPLSLSVSTIITSLLLHLQQKGMYLFGATLRVECPHDIIQGRLYLVCFCPIIIIWISLCCYSTNKVNRSQIDLQEIIVVIVCGRNPGIGSF